MTDFPKRPTPNYLRPKSLELNLNVSAEEEPSTERLTPAAEMKTEKEASRMVTPEMKTDRVTIRVTSMPGEMGTPRMHEGAADAVLVEDEPAPVEAAPTAQVAPDAHRIAAVKNKIVQLDAHRPTQTPAEAKLTEDRHRMAVLEDQVARATEAVAQLSTGNFLVRAWNTSARKTAEKNLTRAQQQLDTVLASHPEWKLKVVTLTHANEVVTPKTRWSTTEATKPMYTVNEKQVMTRYNNLRDTIRAKQALVTRMERERTNPKSLRYEQDNLMRLSAELDKVYNTNKDFLDTLEDDDSIENRA